MRKSCDGLIGPVQRLKRDEHTHLGNDRQAKSLESGESITKKQTGPSLSTSDRFT